MNREEGLINKLKDSKKKKEEDKTGYFFSVREGSEDFFLLVSI